MLITKELVAGPTRLELASLRRDRQKSVSANLLILTHIYG